jgi:hypothetical protein
MTMTPAEHRLASQQAAHKRSILLVKAKVTA